MSKRVISVVTNDLSGDQRVHKTILSLMKTGWCPLLVGRHLKDSKALQRNYPCKRIRMIFTQGFLFYAFYNIRLFLFLFFAKAELIIANDLDTLPAVWLINKIRRIPYVFDSHEYFTEVPELIHRPRVQKIWKTIEQRILPGTKFMLTVNQEIARLFENEYKVKPRVIMNLPMLPKIENSHNEYILPEGLIDRKFIIYQGALNVGRGLEELIDAMAYLPDLCLVIAGDGDISKALILRAKDNNFSDRIIFTGRVPMEQLPSLTRMASLGVSLEKDLGLNYRFALPNKLFDYMQAGIPVLVSSLPLLSAIVSKHQNGLIAQSHDPKYLGAIIESMFSDSTQYDLWCGASRAAALDYTWESQEADLLELFERAVDSS